MMMMMNDDDDDAQGRPHCSPCLISELFAFCRPERQDRMDGQLRQQEALFAALPTTPESEWL
jgi:hypothetical protein